VLKKYGQVKTTGIQNLDPILNKVAGYNFHNKSNFDFNKLIADPNNIASNLRNYINGFSEDARKIIEQFEFLKELRLTEGRGTGIPTIVKALKDNGSNVAEFDTNEPSRTHFLIEIPVHSSFNDQDDYLVNDQADDQASDLVNGLSIEQIKVLEFALKPVKKKELLVDFFGISNQTKNFNTHIKPLMDLNLINMTLPNKPTSQLQEYYTSNLGKGVLDILKNEVRDKVVGTVI